MEKLRIVNVEDMRPEPRAHGTHFAFDRYELAPCDGTCRLGVRVYWLAPGKANYPYHYHRTHEEAFYIIRGQGIAITPDGESPLRAGDVMTCPAGAGGAHQIVNTGAEPLVYLEADAVSFPDVAHYPLVDGMGILFGDREENLFFREGRRVPYDALDEYAGKESL